MTKWSLLRREPCACGRRSGCRWFSCGQPGPQEHAYKVRAGDERPSSCEVFYATEGSFFNDPSSLATVKDLVAHVLGYTDLPPHRFGLCGRLWTIAALQYRLRDGAMASSFALILTPRPVPAALVSTVQILADREKPYKPRGHRLFDPHPFDGLGGGRWGTARKDWLSHLAIAVWSLHASWLARQRLGRHINWSDWQFSHVVPIPSQLLGIRERDIEARIRKARSMSSALVSNSSSPHWVIAPPPLAAASSTVSSRSNHNYSPATPPLHHPRPQSFAGFSRWDQLPSTPPSRRPCAPLPATPADSALPTSHSLPANLPHAGRKPVVSNRNSIVVLEDNGSTYYLTNDMPLEGTIGTMSPNDLDATRDLRSEA